MSFYTSLTGLNGAQADISTISNNVANVGTTGFKRSRAEFGDIFATSPLQTASSAVGSGTILKAIKQQFTQGNVQSSLNSLDLAISGQGFFAMKPNLTSAQTVYTRNGSFSVNNDRYVVDDKGQYLQVFPVNDDGSVTSTGAASANNLQLPIKSGLPNATGKIQLGLNLPADATIIPQDPKYTANNPYVFNHTDPTTYNKSTSITIYDSLGNPTISTIYYVKTSNSSDVSPSNKWDTHVLIGDKELSPALLTAKDAQGQTLYVNKFGQTTTNPTDLDPSFVPNQSSPLYFQDQQINKTSSTPAQVKGVPLNANSFDFGDSDNKPVTIVTDSSQYESTREGGSTSTTSPFWGKDMFTISVDGSTTKSISINAGSYTGERLAAEMTRAANAAFSDSKYFRINDTYRDVNGTVLSGNDTFNIKLAKTGSDGSITELSPPLEIDLIGTAGSAGTPKSGNQPQQLDHQDLTREELIALAQTKVNAALDMRHTEFGQSAGWVKEDNPPIKVGFDVATRSLTFQVDPSQLGPDASLPGNRFQTLQVANPTSALNDLGLPPITESPKIAINSTAKWKGQAVLPSGPAMTAETEQRTGILVTYSAATRQFIFSSGTTGEASSITVGRASLAQTETPQLNSYDFSNLSLAAGQSFTFESDGRTFTYKTPVAVDPAVTYPASSTDSTWPSISPEDFINNLQQSLPVSFGSAIPTTIGTLSQREVQLVPVNGNLLTGDQFQVKLQLGTDPTVAVPLTVDLPGPYTDETADQRLSDLVDNIRAAIADEALVQNITNPPSVVASNGKITFSYNSEGVVSSPISITQTVRGTSDGVTTQSPIHFTDPTLTTSPTSVVQSGNARFPEIQQLTLQPQTFGGIVRIVAGDKFNLSVPLGNGTFSSETVTVPAFAAPKTGLQALAETLSDGSHFLNAVTFSVSPDNANTLIMQYRDPGSIVGSFSLKQFARIDASVDPAVATQIRPNSIGPFSISLAPGIGRRMVVEGNPNGSPYRLNVQANGVVKSAEVKGAPGSKTEFGRQIGESLASNTNQSAFMAGHNDLLGIGVANVEQILGKGLSATPAIATGTTAVTPMSEPFLPSETLGDNKMTFNIDGITGTVTIPIRTYTGVTLAAAIEQRINQIQDPSTGRVVSGAKVSFDAANNRLVFKSGTTGLNSQFTVVGSANLGLNSVSQTSGKVPQIKNLTQATDASGKLLYVDGSGTITTTAPSTRLQSWSPLYLTPGELTFDSSGKLTSPSEGVVYSPFNPSNGANPLNLTIDYGKYSTQYQQSFSVLSLQQDGYTAGQFDGLNIDASGTVRANYTNGQTKALGKIMLANFANPNGLKQVGNSNYVANSISGDAVLGQAGSDGFGSIQSGALERSNVDITEELVNLITAQRNFQANSKAIETETTLTQTIIQIRG